MKSDSATNIKNNFGAYLDRVKRGEVVIILEYGRPVAQMCRPILDGANHELGLKQLEREGIVSLPNAKLTDPSIFLADRPKLKNPTALLDALRKDRDESL